MLRAASGRGLSLEEANVRALGGSVAAKLAMERDAATNLAAVGTTFEPPAAGIATLDIETAAFSPFSVRLGLQGALVLDIPIEVLEAGLARVCPPTPENGAVFLDTMLDGVVQGAALEIGPSAHSVRVESHDAATLRAVTDVVRRALADPASTRAAVARFAERAGIALADDGSVPGAPSGRQFDA